MNVVAALPAPPTALNVTGILGTGLAVSNIAGVNYLAAVNNALGGGNTNTTASADCSLTLQLPATFNPSRLVIKVIGSGGSISQTVAGLASQLQQAINTTLAINVAGASVTCSAAPNGAQFRDPCKRLSAESTRRHHLILRSAGRQRRISGIWADHAHSGERRALRAGHRGGQRTVAVCLDRGYRPHRASGKQRADRRSAGFHGHLRTAEGADLQPAVHSRSRPRHLPGNPNTPDPAVNPVQVYSAAIALCDQQRAMLLIDPPPNVELLLVRWIGRATRSVSWTRMAPPSSRGCGWPTHSNKGQLRTFAPSGVVAGLYARSDAPMASGPLPPVSRPR